MIREKSYTADPANAHQRFDRSVLSFCPSSARALVIKAIETGQILLNGKRADKGTRIQAGDVIRVRQLPEKADVTVQPNPRILLEILYEDAGVLIVNKPAGVPVHPIRHDQVNTLANGLVAKYPGLAGIGDSPLFPAFVHRLDTDTSGVLAAAKNEDAYWNLRRQFQDHKVEKIYMALVHGRVSGPGTLEDDLAHKEGNRGRMVVLQNKGKKDRSNIFRAVTRIDIEKRFPEHTLLKVRISTGVTHQIRCQLAHRGYPIVGDKVYGGRMKRDQPALARQFLHASEIQFAHPVGGRRVRVSAPLPPDLESYLRRVAKSGVK